MVDFSIVFNSRGRPKMLQECIKCIADTTKNIDKLECIVNFDIDDRESIETGALLATIYPFFKYIVSERFINIHYKVNELAFMAKGNWVWSAGDDCFMRTNGWDEIAKNKFLEFYKTHPDKIALGAVESTSCDKDISQIGWYTDAPIISKEARNATGVHIYDHFISLGADVHTYRIYKEVGRVIDMREIVFDHVTHQTVQQVINPDKTAAEYRARQAKIQQLNPFTIDISKEVEHLRSKLYV